MKLFFSIATFSGEKHMYSRDQAIYFSWTIGMRISQSGKSSKPIVGFSLKRCSIVQEKISDPLAWFEDIFHQF